jgi:hypothetical protein
MSCLGGPVTQNWHRLPAATPVAWTPISVLCRPNARSSG